MRALVLVLHLVLVGAAAGCESAGKPFDYPLDRVLRLDEAQVKGTHNSFHIDTFRQLPAWQYTMAPLDEQLDRQGVRQLELDLNWVTDETGAARIEVYHYEVIDAGTTCLAFRDCLETVRTWSERYPGHLPIYIELEPKPSIDASNLDQFFAQTEADILAAFPRESIITPDEIQGDAATLPAALAGGWPTLGDLRGRVFFAFDDHDLVRAAYTHGLGHLHDRLIFVDSGPDDPFGAIAILNDPAGQAAEIARARAAHLLVRTRADADTVQAQTNDYTLLEDALAEGTSFISTDFPAPVEGVDYVVTIPDGTPARCNPVGASGACTSLALEDPRFVGSGLGM